MKIAVTGKQNITSKKGDEYVIVYGITSKGKSVQAFLTKGQASELPDSLYPDKQEIEEVFSSLSVADFDFNESGRVEDVTFEEEED